MEPEVKEFLIKIVHSLSMGLVWLLINMSIGIYYGFAFFEGSPTIANWLYYIGFLVSLALLILYLRKKWKGWEEINY
ncbi:MAG: hypothetical protein H7Z13_18805 [Ferruginibacter sp.]|nr:hypothetical protein [Ferruginibacter sp.]